MNPEDFQGKSAEECIRMLELSPLPGEGGFFRRVYTSQTSLGDSDGETRGCASVGIYLLRGFEVSRLHRLKGAEELWFFLAGAPVEHFMLHEGKGKSTFLGVPEADFAVLVPPGAWQGARLVQPSRGSYALFHITVCPEYASEECELAREEELRALYPEWEAKIRQFL